MTLGILNIQSLTKKSQKPNISHLCYLPNHDGVFAFHSLPLQFLVRQNPKEMPLFTATIALGSVSGSLSFLSNLFTTSETSSNQCSPSLSSLLSPISNNLSKRSQRCCSRRTPWICSASNVSNNTENYGQAGTASDRVLSDSSPPPEAIRPPRVRFVFSAFPTILVMKIFVRYKTHFFGIGGGHKNKCLANIFCNA